MSKERASLTEMRAYHRGLSQHFESTGINELAKKHDEFSNVLNRVVRRGLKEKDKEELERMIQFYAETIGFCIDKEDVADKEYWLGVMESYRDRARECISNIDQMED